MRGKGRAAGGHGRFARVGFVSSSSRHAFRDLFVRLFRFSPVVIAWYRTVARRREGMPRGVTFILIGCLACVLPTPREPLLYEPGLSFDKGNPVPRHKRG